MTTRSPKSKQCVYKLWKRLPSVLFNYRHAPIWGVDWGHHRPSKLDFVSLHCCFFEGRQIWFCFSPPLFFSTSFHAMALTFALLLYNHVWFAVIFLHSIKNNDHKQSLQMAVFEIRLVLKWWLLKSWAKLLAAKKRSVPQFLLLTRQTLLSLTVPCTDLCFNDSISKTFHED